MDLVEGPGPGLRPAEPTQKLNSKGPGCPSGDHVTMWDRLRTKKISEVLSKSGSIGIEAVVASLDLHLRRYRTGGGWPCRVGIQG